MFKDKSRKNGGFCLIQFLMVMTVFAVMVYSLIFSVSHYYNCIMAKYSESELKSDERAVQNVWDYFYDNNGECSCLLDVGGNKIITVNNNSYFDVV